MVRTLWLAAYLTMRERGRGPLGLILALGIVCITVLALATVSVPQVVADRADRVEALTPQLDLTDATDSRRLRMIDPFASDGRRWGGHQVVRQYFVRGESSLVAPGVSRMPGPDEYFASPELSRLVHEDSTIAALFEGRRMVGVIGASGLTQPHELRAIEGISADVPLLRNVERFGGPGATDQSQLGGNATLDRVVGWFVVALIWLPAIAFLVIITRLASRRRAARARSLRLVGLSTRTTLAVHAVETLLICVPAIVVGCLVHDVIAGRLTRIPGTSIGFFSAELDVSPLTYAAVAVVLTGLVALTTAGSLRRALDGRRLESGGPVVVERSRVGLVALAVGVLILVLTPVLIQVVGSIMAIGLWLACALVAIGLALAGPATAAAALRRAGSAAGSGTTLVGMRMASTASTSLRLGSLLSIIIVLLLGGLSFMNLLNGGSAQDWDKRLSHQPQVPVVVNDLVGGLRLEQVAATSQGSGAVQLQERKQGRRSIAVVFGGCDDLEILTGAGAKSCHDGPQWLSTWSGDGSKPGARPGGELELSDAARVSLPASDDVAHVDGLPPEFDGALLLPARLAPGESTGSSYFYFVVPNASLRETLAGLSAAAPMVQFDLGELDRHNPDTQQFPAQLEWLTLGSCVGLLLGGFALAAVALGEARERSARMRGLRVLGTSRLQMLRIHLWCTATPIVILGWSATVAGWLVCTAMQNVDDRSTVDLGAMTITAVAALAAGLVIGAVTYPDALRKSAGSASVEG